MMIIADTKQPKLWIFSLQ